MGLLSGRKILVTGLLSNRSIAYGIAKAARREGAELALTYQNERFRDRVTGMAREFGSEGALPMMRGRRASLLTLTYLGAERVVPNYNTMGLAKASLEASVRYLAASLGPQGIRVNGISAGPIKTLAAAGIGGFGRILKFVEEHSPLRRNVTTEDVGNAAAFLLSDLAAAITGEILHVDAGFSHVVAGIAGAGGATSSPD